MSFLKNTATYVSYLTHMAVFSALHQLSLFADFFKSCRLLGLMQAVHTSAICR